MPLHKLTNTTTDQRRAIYTEDGYVTIEPGQSRVLDVTDADLKANKDYFKVESATDDDVKAQDAADTGTVLNPPEALPVADEYDAMSDDMLRDHIEDTDGKRPDGRMGRAKLLELARKN